MTKAIAGLALLGLAISAYLTWVHYAVIEPVCSGISDCERVQNSSYAELVGVPVAVLGVAGYAAILASLWARVEVTALLAYLAVAFSGYRIRVNQLNVGWTLTEGEERVQRADGKGENWVADAVATRPFGRLLMPADIAIAAAYFASDDSALISGAVVDLEHFPVGALPSW